ncbi:hypothetical protein BOX15_Mlig000161g2, partial [Macrostomum lignano]
LVSNHFCRTEVVFYGLTGPVLERVMEQYNIERVFPRAFGQKISDKGTILVMEDMTKQGFSLVDRKSFGIEQAYCVVRTLARLQAAFWIARVNFNYSLDSVLFGRESPFSDGIRKSGVDLKEILEQNTKYFFENLHKHVPSHSDRELIQELVKKLIATLVADPMKGVPAFTDEPVGISHGDLWFSNFMFKGDGGSMICRLFDWQFWDVSVFGLDLGLLMISSLSTEAMQEHVDKIPKEFYRTFKEIYESKTGNPVPFSEEAALGNMGHSLFSALFWVIVTSGTLWESANVDVSSMLANVAFAIRTKRIMFPFEF